MKDQNKDVEDAVIHDVKGVPKRSNKNESSRFRAFLAFFLPRLKKQEELAIAFEEATVRKLDAEGEKLLQEAAKLAAEKDIARQQELKLFQENVERTFSADDRPEVVLLKMAKLLQSNPEIAAQLNKVNSVLDRLASERNCHVTFREPDDPK